MVRVKRTVIVEVVSHTMHCVGETIREHRIATGLTQTQMAKKLNLSQSAYARIECAKSHVSIDTFARIADVLKIFPGDLLSKAFKS